MATALRAAMLSPAAGNSPAGADRARVCGHGDGLRLFGQCLEVGQCLEAIDVH